MYCSEWWGVIRTVVQQEIPRLRIVCDYPEVSRL